MGKIRGTHSTPGLYTKITDLQYTAASAGITTLGLVGETQKGPAFEPIAISNWREFQEYFGGTSTEKFKGSEMPKYELPYIAKSYLSASDQLYVSRVLGLSGYNAGPAFLLYLESGSTEEDNITRHVIGILRSRATYGGVAVVDENGCRSVEGNFDTLTFRCEKAVLSPYTDALRNYTCGTQPSNGEQKEGDVTISTVSSSKFIINCNPTNEKETEFEATYAVSLNPGDKEYIYNVLGSTPSDGNALLFVESLYDVEMENILKGTQYKLGIDKISGICDYTIISEVSDFLTLDKLTNKYVNQKFVANVTTLEENKKPAIIKLEEKVDDKGNVVYDDVTCDTGLTIGGIYTISKEVDDKGGIAYVIKEVPSEIKDGKVSHLKLTNDNDIVFVNSTNYNYILKDGKLEIIKSISNYKEQFRHAMTPWFVSELKGDAYNVDIKKLFRLHTITDGTAANEQVKITIANVRPDEGTFDLFVRDFFDNDANQVVLESYKGVNLVPGTSKYLGLKMGTLNGDYPRKSKYVIAEIIENDMTESCVPCGFLGYPKMYAGSGFEMPDFVYNTMFDEDVRVNKQTFGLSDIKGVDVDMLYYKGVEAYTETYGDDYTSSFHLDSRVDVMTDDGKITLDGEPMENMSWKTVDVSNTTSEGLMPIIDSEAMMKGTIYEDVKVRKFTCYPYGGFDGWDIYRSQRTNGDKFKATKYQGTISQNCNVPFGNITDGDGLRLDSRAITSDYYAYLAGVKQFENPEEYQINLFATPGIDYVNQKMLVDEVIDMIHDRQDCFYVVTSPDKPNGASESVDEMYSASDAVGNLDDSGIDTYYASTYYPWVRYYDADNARFISLPVTKDVLRNMADVDNKKYPWFAPAGIERGNVDCTKARIFTKMGDTDTAYDGRINPVKTFSADGVKIWGNKTLYSGDTPMNRINTVRLVLYMRKLIDSATKVLFFEPNDTTLKAQFDSILRPILTQIQADRGIVDFRLKISQTAEQMDEHEISAELYIKPTPTLEYIEINFIVTPMGVQWDD